MLCLVNSAAYKCPMHLKTQIFHMSRRNSTTDMSLDYCVIKLRIYTASEEYAMQEHSALSASLNDHTCDSLSSKVSQRRNEILYKKKSKKRKEKNGTIQWSHWSKESAVHSPSNPSKALKFSPLFLICFLPF